jgi:uncharacterized membrane protein
MGKKILVMLTVAALIALASISSTWAYASFSIYGYTDKPQYRPGEKGTLKIWVYNDGTEDLILKNMTLYYPWHNIVWGGNETLVPSADTVIAPKGNYSTTTQFTIPNDGRAEGGLVTILVVTDKGTDDGQVTLNVANPPVSTAFENMDNLITLFSALVIITLIGIIGIVFTIYLTARRPKMVWAEEPKQQ